MTEVDVIKQQMVEICTSISKTMVREFTINFPKCSIVLYVCGESTNKEVLRSWEADTN
jgi:hypothetical protein